MADVKGFAARKAESEKKGMLRGLGYACYIEACGLAPSNIAGALGARAGLFEAGEVRVHPTGKVTVFTGSHSHGQGHETTFSQVVADRLGIPLEDVDIQHGDTGKVLFGMGTYGSRSIAVGGTAIVKAVDKVIAKGKKIAAHLLEASEADIEFSNGEFRVFGTDRKKAFAEVSLAAYVPHNYPLDKLEPGLNENAFYDPTNFTYPAGSYICEVEVDPATGVVRIDRFSACDDFGNVINPMIVEGQVHGGVVHGIGQALLEHGIYNEDGQLVTGSYMDYAMPRADDLPSIKVETVKGTPCTHNPLGVKGCGEAGAIGSPAAVMNAVTDALWHLGVKDVPMPATPHNVWKTIAAARQLIRGDDDGNACTITAPPRWPMPSSWPASMATTRSSPAASRCCRRCASDCWRRPAGSISPASPELQGIRVDGNAVVIGAMTTHADGRGVEGRAVAHPGAGAARRWDRRPAGAQPRHDWRLAGE